ncbi:hypothetical protein DICVIV_13772 [Dictyocaulus viviparus]|uniref:Mitochondrial import inner membrane translocase subunit TIM17 n=1 Tax=Dictyocaulus viviparus TaxID=29172 RepID=A0A0D8X704_DICVI|nr:hypothetical protein DICVIV_13772 [Dictyocaulus viviparus]
MLVCVYQREDFTTCFGKYFTAIFVRGENVGRNMQEYTREPCPYRIGDDLGSAFAMGFVGGSIFQAFSGYKHAAKGHKLLGMLREVRMRSSVTGVQFAAWGGMFSTIDCCSVAIRKKVQNVRKYPFNSIAFGGLTVALLAIRSGPKVMAGPAILGSVILAMIEGVGLITTRWMGSMVDPTAPPLTNFIRRH